MSNGSCTGPSQLAESKFATASRLPSVGDGDSDARGRGSGSKVRFKLHTKLELVVKI